jgi:O-antigen ligase
MLKAWQRSITLKTCLSASLLIPCLWVIINNSKGLVFWNAGQQSADSEASQQIYYEGSALDRIALSGLLVLGLVILFRRRQALLELLRHNLLIIMLIIDMAISLIWADYQFVAFKRWVKTFGTFVMVALIATEPQPFLAARLVMKNSCIFILIVSALLIVFLPAVGTMFLADQGLCWSGLATHKTQLGQWAALAALLFVWEASTGAAAAQKRGRFLLQALGAVIILVGSKSSASLGLFGLGGLILALIGVARRTSRFGLTTLLLLAGTLGCGTFFFFESFMPQPLIPALLQALGKDPTLTGRSDIWEMSLSIANQRALLGYGYATFWMTKSADEIRRFCGWDFFSAHNGFIDIYLQLGLMGLFLTLCYLGRALQTIRSLFQRNSEVASLWLAFFGVILASNFFESNLGLMAHEFWFVLLLISLRLPARVQPG